MKFNFDPGSTQPVAAPRRLQQPGNITSTAARLPPLTRAACVNAIFAEGRTAYGINTGLLLAQTRISTEDLEILQRCWCYPTRRRWRAAGR